MRQIKNILLCGLLALVGAGCENDGFYYQDEARIRLVGPEIWTVGTDSLEFSFLTYPSGVTEMQMDVEAWVMGPVADRERVANIAIDPTLTTAGTHLYTCPSAVTVPAGENKVVFPVVLKRADELQTGNVRLYIKVAESDDFAIGNNEQNHLLFKWNDVISKPKNWDTELIGHFGEYSNVKYRFILDHSNEPDGFVDMDWATLHNYNLIFTNALNEYNAAHPDAWLRDENGVLVTFPEGN